MNKKFVYQVDNNKKVIGVYQLCFNSVTSALRMDK